MKDTGKETAYSAPITAARDKPADTTVDASAATDTAKIGFTDEELNKITQSVDRGALSLLGLC